MILTPAIFRQRLKALGMTLDEFAALTGKHRDTVANWGKTKRGMAHQIFPLWTRFVLWWLAVPDRPHCDWPDCDCQPESAVRCPIDVWMEKDKP